MFDVSPSLNHEEGELATVAVIEICTGRNFRISPGPARGTLGLSLKFIIK
jgi:hypothetical protein